MYSMKETCKKIGMTYETLKYYCNINLVPNVKRDKNNYRVFDDKDIAWLESLQCLRKAGMSLKDMKQYMEYCLLGESSINQREEMLDATKKLLLEQMADLTASLTFIDKKKVYYQDVKDGKIAYSSNLIDVKK